MSHVSVASGMAFVVVQHLDPTRKGLMAELLQRSTAMEVVQVKDHTRVRADCVYVIPPNKDMSILHGVLHLFEPTEARGMRFPIDYFFRSLAQDQRQHGVGVILSGMGSDGTLGVRAIKEKMGLVVVQEPSSAKFDSMPRSVIDAGLADIVALVEELPARISAHFKHPPPEAKAGPSGDEMMQSALEKILILVRTRTSYDFTLYKSNTLYRRIERRMGIHQVDRIAQYVKYLGENPQEIDLLFKEFLIGVTGFFRDPLAWEVLREETLPALVASRPVGSLLRAWVAGCSTGEEAYSLAIAFKEATENSELRKNLKLQIFATDLDADAIAKARHGVFSENGVSDMSSAQIRRFFTKEEGGYQVRAEIREMVIFSPHSLIMDPPFTRLDILSCRNLLIYLSAAIQKKLFPLFHYSLAPGGVLFLGNSETIGQFTDLFETLSGKSRIFRRMESPIRLEPIDFPSSFSYLPRLAASAPLDTKPQPSLQILAEQLVLRHYAPPTVLVNEQGNILYISGHTGKYLEPAAGKANWNIFAMARVGLRRELTGAVQQALRQIDPVVLKGLKVVENRGFQWVDVTVQKIEESEPLRGLLIVLFVDVPVPLHVQERKQGGKKTAPPKQAVRLAMEVELQQALAEVQNTRDEMQVSQEELRATNEEMQSTNEEMQSTNEELTTSKEEMQSLNEELQTVNAELQCKVDELSRSNNDMKNLLNSTDIATLFLDNDMKVRRFTTQATKIIQLIPGDVGRPITDLASDLIYPELTEDASEVLRKLGFSEKPIRSRDGRWFAVRIMPYRTLDDRIDGVVITFGDITVAKTLEGKLNEMQCVLEKRLLGQATKLDKARVDLKAERKRTQKAVKKQPDAGEP